MAAQAFSRSRDYTGGVREIAGDQAAMSSSPLSLRHAGWAGSPATQARRPSPSAELAGSRYVSYRSKGQAIA